jgi:hypothetical protein
MMHIAVQRIRARPVIVRRVVIDGISRGEKANLSVISGLVARTVRRLAWLQIACRMMRRGFSTSVWFWNIPVLGAEETQESRYLRTGRFN